MNKLIKTISALLILTASMALSTPVKEITPGKYELITEKTNSDTTLYTELDLKLSGYYINSVYMVTPQDTIVLQKSVGQYSYTEDTLYLSIYVLVDFLTDQKLSFDPNSPPFGIAYENDSSRLTLHVILEDGTVITDRWKLLLAY